MYFNEKHKQIVENRGYIYICSYDRKEVTLEGKNKKMNKIHIRVKCPYCGKKYDIDIYNFKDGANCKFCCNFYENSFAYYIEEELGLDLNDIWDWEENGRLNINPWDIYKSTGKIKVWIWCQDKCYHGSYDITPNKFTSRGDRCPYCNPFASHRVHKLDSFGYLYPSKAKYWSDNNKESPYEVAVFSHGKYLFKCEKCGEEFERYLNNINGRGDSLKCPDCTSSQLEQETSKILQKYNIKYIPQKSYEGLIGKNHGNLSYDFYLPNYNLLIECQGIQHEKWIEGWITKEGFEKQLEHDRRKKQYAIDYKINFLEIWYYDIDNIEQILIKQLNLI